MSNMSNTDKNLADLRAFQTKLEAAKKMRVKVGLPSGKTIATHVYDGGQSVFEIGAKHEFGIGVPRRSWLRNSVEANRPAIIKTIHAQFDLAKGAGAPVDKAMDTIGITVRNFCVRAFRTNGFDSWAPLSPATMAEKAARGKSTTLIDTGTLRQSITWRVE